MAEKILLTVHELQQLLGTDSCVVFDCRFDLVAPEAGREGYLEAHIPGALYAHLDNDLSSLPDSTSGRHPLPEADKFAQFLASSGWQPGKRVVVYDNAGGAIAARLWWLMRYFGHDCGALLDGGIAAWCEAGFQLEAGQTQTTAAEPVILYGNDDYVLSSEALIARLASNELVLADARAYERFCGEFEPIDAVAGHIPGSVSYPFDLNLNPNGTFRPVADIQQGLQTLLKGHKAEDLAHMCGSGVTACQNLFSAELAGLKGSKLYVGSWSEWIQDPSRPIEVCRG